MSGSDTSDPVRVLIVDDSATARAFLAGLFAGDPDVEVVGEATDGDEAVELTAELRPSIVIMDIHMPRMDGFAATRAIMAETPTPVVAVSAISDPEDPAVARHALEAGAVSVLVKPPGPPSGLPDSRFVPRVKALADVGVIRRRRSTGPVHGPPVAVDASREVELVVVAASTGGPASLQRFLGALPRKSTPPLVVVQHIVEGFTTGLASWLNSTSPVRVRVATDGERLVGSTAYLAPDGTHLHVGRSHVKLTDDEPVNGFRPSADVLLTSAAAAFGPAVAAVVLTGMGSDGLAGARDVRAAGGVVLAQDEASSAVYGMPRAVAEAGLATVVAPVEKLAATIDHLTSPRNP